MTEIILKDYKITVGPVSSALSVFLKQKDYSGIYVIVDENTKEHCLPVILSVLPPFHLIKIQSGEEHKDIQSCLNIWSQLREAGADRQGLIINLGGGVIGDMGGFCASCYMRGMDFIQIPTTLLSQVDASVGGKLGIDYEGYKNFIGLFRNPKAILVDPVFLKTLPHKELRSGFSEVIKHGLIRRAEIWQKIKSAKDWEDLEWRDVILESIDVKRKIVESDPFEKGLRKVLNFGHTIGHAIESVSFSTDRPLLHGEAIALGMISEAYLSVKKTGLKNDELVQIQKYLLEVFSDLPAQYLNDHQEILHLMKGDKKNKKGIALFSLLSGIGKSVYDIEISGPEVIESLIYTSDLLK